MASEHILVYISDSMTTPWPDSQGQSESRTGVVSIETTSDIPHPCTHSSTTWTTTAGYNPLLLEALDLTTRLRLGISNGWEGIAGTIILQQDGSQ